jgi:hypothetical protein
VEPPRVPQPDEGVGITAGIAREDRARLVAKYGRAVAAGEVLFREGEVAREAFLLQEGGSVS